MTNTFDGQARFNPEDVHYKTMKTMDRSARLAMMPEYDMYCVDLKEGEAVEHCNQIVSKPKYNMWQHVIMICLSQNWTGQIASSSTI